MLAFQSLSNSKLRRARFLSVRLLNISIFCLFYFVAMALFQVHSIVTVRDAKHTNFVEFRNFKIIYRRYSFILSLFLFIQQYYCYSLVHMSPAALHEFLNKYQYCWRTKQTPVTATIWLLLVLTLQLATECLREKRSTV